MLWVDLVDRQLTTHVVEANSNFRELPKDSQTLLNSRLPTNTKEHDELINLE